MNIKNPNLNQISKSHDFDIQILIPKYCNFTAMEEKYTYQTHSKKKKPLKENNTSSLKK